MEPNKVAASDQHVDTEEVSQQEADDKYELIRIECYDAHRKAQLDAIVNDIDE